MKPLNLNNPLVYLVGGFLIAFSIYLFVHMFEGGGKLQEAADSYRAGENAKTIAERQEAFNNALKLYKELEAEYHPIYGNGKLYYDIANTFFQLGQYGQAAYYYYQAEELMPRSEDVQQNLKQALMKLGNYYAPQESVFKKIFFFHNYLSLPERLQLFFVMALATLALSSAYIWSRRRILKGFIALAGFICLIFFISVCYSRYFEPVEGVVVQAVSLYRDAGTQYAKVKKEPVLAGTKVEVLAVLKEGKWLKILTPDGTLGYLPANSTRVIE